jgi:hypothetical protein
LRRQLDQIAGGPGRVTVSWVTTRFGVERRIAERLLTDGPAHPIEGDGRAVRTWNNLTKPRSAPLRFGVKSETGVCVDRYLADLQSLQREGASSLEPADAGAWGVAPEPSRGSLVFGILDPDDVQGTEAALSAEAQRRGLTFLADVVSTGGRVEVVRRARRLLAFAERESGHDGSPAIWRPAHRADAFQQIAALARACLAISVSEQKRADSGAVDPGGAYFERRALLRDRDAQLAAAGPFGEFARLVLDAPEHLWHAYSRLARLAEDPATQSAFWRASLALWRSGESASRDQLGRALALWRERMLPGEDDGTARATALVWLFWPIRTTAPAQAGEGRLKQIGESVLMSILRWLERQGGPLYRYLPAFDARGLELAVIAASVDRHARPTEESRWSALLPEAQRNRLRAGPAVGRS